MRARIVTTAAVFALSALALTGCGGNSDDSKKAGDESSATASSESPSKESGSGGASTGGNAGDQGDGATAACTTKNTRLQFIQSPGHASQQKPAQATLSVTNTSKTPCTIVGAVTLTAKDDQGKADPVETDNTEGGTDAVDVKPGGTAQASVAYTDLNFDGSPSGREICAVQATKVEIALPKDVGRTVKVIKDGGAPGSFNVCGKDVRVSAFTS